VTSNLRFEANLGDKEKSRFEGVGSRGDSPSRKYAYYKFPKRYLIHSAILNNNNNNNITII
jgi:hypothetical protein